MREFGSQIDLTTMLFVNAFTSLVSACLFLGFWRATDYVKRPASLLLWSLANILMTSGFVALMLSAFNIMVPRIQLIANLTIDVGMAVALVATNLFLNRPSRDNWPIGFAVLLALVEVAYALSLPKPDFGVMLLFGCALRGLLTIATGVALWRHADLPHRPPARLAAVLHFAWAGIMGLRSLAVLAGAESTLAFEISTVVGLVARLLLTWMIAVCLLWMIARQLDERLVWQATRDALTGLSNRRVMWEAGAKRIESLAQESADLALILLDIDNFKRLNDRWGHLAGDAVLVAVATRIAETVRSTDLVARVGGEEFMILLAPGPEAIEAEIAERIRVSIETMSVFLSDGTELRCTASLGHSRAARQGATWEALITQADMALYAAKHGGRNRVVDHTLLVGRSHDGGIAANVACTGMLYPAG
ncbi:diguanylate cyclase [Sphingobium sp. CR2-8]|uniref:GGDEF domain-containing protein n=1 Tax=Sphingobium sp. CR2-8 TaxID=1306534 RepID=UPI002DBB590D|nr:diguanylate cyclase [Sphingobium sp. CR2-8]MEC3911944.1 diguanylate cyclase [Sphingobium sp. CR2-8]